MANVVLDAGILIDFENRKRPAQLWIKEAVERGDGLFVAGATYTEVWHGPNRSAAHELSRILKLVDPVATTDKIGKRAGEVLTKAGADKQLRFDAIVVATAESIGADVLTNDFKDIGLLACYTSVRVLSTRK